MLGVNYFANQKKKKKKTFIAIAATKYSRGVLAIMNRTSPVLTVTVARKSKFDADAGMNGAATAIARTMNETDERYNRGTREWKTPPSG